MAMSTISAAGFHAATQQAMQSLAGPARGGHRHGSNTDIDTAGSSVSTAASSTGKIGSKLDVTA